MDKEQIKMIVLCGLAVFIGGLIRALFSGGQKPALPAIMRLSLVGLVAIIIAVLIIKNLK